METSYAIFYVFFNVIQIALIDPETTVMHSRLVRQYSNFCLGGITLFSQFTWVGKSKSTFPAHQGMIRVTILDPVGYI